MPFFKITQEREVTTKEQRTAYVEAPDEIWLKDHTEDIEEMLDNDIGDTDEHDYDCEVDSFEIVECSQDDLLKHRAYRKGTPDHVFTRTPEEIEEAIENGEIPVPGDPRQIPLRLARG